MNILVTGGLGFIGSNFVRYVYKHTDWEIVILDKLTYSSNTKNVGDIVGPRVIIHIGDICDPQVVNGLVSSVDTVINFAAEVSNDRSLKNPKKFIQTNIYGTFILLEAIKKYNKRFHQVSTDEVFGDLPISSDESFNLDSKYNPSSPYAATKASADHLVSSYVRSFGVQATISNCTNNFGPFASVEKMIPFQITNILKGKKARIYGNGLHVRDWIYVEDHCAALLKILQKGKLGSTYLISANHPRNNLDVVKFILTYLDKDAHDFYVANDRPGHDLKYSLDNSSIANELGWKPSFSFEEALIKTIEWYREHRWFWENSTYLGVILAAGNGTRLKEISLGKNKHLLPIAHKPQIIYPVSTLVESGVKEIVILTQTQNIKLFKEIVREHFPDPAIRFYFAIDNESIGTARSLNIVTDLYRSKKYAVIFGDNIFTEDFCEKLTEFKDGCIVFSTHVVDPERFGVIAVDKTGKVTELEEKPKIPQSNFVLTGGFLFDSKIRTYLKKVKASVRGEYELSDAIRYYIENGDCRYVELKHTYFDMGTIESYNNARNFFT